MRTKTLYTLTFALLLGSSSISAGVTSLRGDKGLEEDSNEVAKVTWQKDGPLIDRSFRQQPPMVPHQVDKYQVNLQNNECLSCHDLDNYKKKKATLIGESHFKDREGDVLEEVSSRRYFCNQCHAPQSDAQPLVNNNFGTE